MSHYFTRPKKLPLEEKLQRESSEKLRIIFDEQHTRMTEAVSVPEERTESPQDSS